MWNDTTHCALWTLALMSVRSTTLDDACTIPSLSSPHRYNPDYNSSALPLITSLPLTLIVRHNDISNFITIGCPID